jgi:hypothetical protein
MQPVRVEGMKKNPIFHWTVWGKKAKSPRQFGFSRKKVGTWQLLEFVELHDTNYKLMDL